MSHDVNSDYARLYLDLGQARWCGDYRKWAEWKIEYLRNNLLLDRMDIFSMRDEI